MFIEAIKSPGLAQISYLIGDEGEAVVIDPRRDAEIYLSLARERDFRLIGALETHIHADFVSGARELEQLAGVPLYGGKSDDYGYELNQLADGAKLEVGALTLTALHTPGHSPEHLCYVIEGGEGAEKPWGIFTGDALFAGSVGRPDLAAGVKPEELARQLHDSIFNKILPLGDGIIVYPGHGSGSPCGGSIGDRDQTTLGYEAAHGEKLQSRGVDAFVEKVFADLPDEPAYYKRLKKLNARGAALHGRVPLLKPLSPDEFSSEAKAAFVLDVREVTDFGSAHVPGSINIALRTSFPPWAGRIVPPEGPVYLVGTSYDDVLEAHTTLFRMGFDNVTGYLNGGIREWITGGLPIAQIGMMSITTLKESLEAGEAIQLLDVRTPDEWEAGRLPKACHIFAAEIRERIGELDPEKKTVVYCGSDFRADLVASLLAANGFRNLHTLLGSFQAWKRAGFRIED